MKQKFLLLIVAAFFSLNGIAQHDHKFCATEEASQEMIRKFPEDYRKAKAEWEEHLKNYNDNNKSARPPVYIIPVVFHVLHEYGTENISDAQIQDAIRVMNEDFRKLNADTVDIVSAFKPIAGDAEIEFRLARLDPNGNCTNGIDRIVSPLTNVGDNSAKLNPWPRNRYLNVWVVRAISSGAAGYSQYPISVSGPGGAAVDGIMILHSYVGSIGTSTYGRSRTMTHEAGHWINLAHLWGNSNSPNLASNCNEDDGVADTPNTIGWTTCNLNGTSCGSLDNVQNYMEYSYCSRMFTQGQATRMRAALTSTVASRNNLWTSGNLNFTGVNVNPAPLCAPKADFNSNAKTVCVGVPIQFTDFSWNGAPTSWDWSFTGGNPSTATTQNATVTYTSPGVYPVSLTVSNAAGSNTATRQAYITVLPDTAQYNGVNFFEGFESLTIGQNNWMVDNSAGPGWAVFTSSGFNSQRSMRLNNLMSTAGAVDDFLTPTFDLTGFSGVSPRLYFQVAYAQLPTSVATANTLEIWVSTDCGVSWIRRRAITGTSLATVPAQSANFTPTNASQWRTEEVNLNAYASSNNIRFRFRFIAGEGNNVYIDNINIAAPLSLSENLASDIQLAVFPNPSSEQVNINFNLDKPGTVNLSLHDMLGRDIWTDSHQSAMGEQRFILNKSQVPAAGIYLMKIQIDEGVITRKIVFE
jgi:PKD repeat protein